MVAKRRPLTAEERAETEFQDELAQAAKRIADDLGPAPGTVRTSEAKKRTLWWTRDPAVDRATLVGMLQQGGVPPDLLETLMIVEEQPDLKAAYQQPTDPRTADVLAAMAEWPFRYAILRSIDDPDDRVREATRLTNLGPPGLKQDEQAPTPDANRMQPLPHPSEPMPIVPPMRDPMMPAAAPAGRY